MDDDDATTDWISALPDFIIHHILSFLPTEDVARTSSLSNRWHSVHASFPILEFNQSQFGITSDLIHYSFPLKKSNPVLFATYKNFMQHVDTKLLGFCTNEKNLDLQKFVLSMDIIDMELASAVDKWIDLAIQSGVKELHLHIRKLIGISFHPDPQGYTVPQTVFVACRALATLVLNDCVFKLDGGDHAQLNLHSLRKLSLEYVHMDDHTVNQLFSSFLLMEEIILIRCPGFKDLHIFGLVKLKQLLVRLCSTDHLQSIHIDTPSLQTLYIDSTFRSDNYPCTINMDACHGLKTLDIETTVVQGMLFHQFSAKFPFLVRLNLAYCRWIERLDISSRHLQSLKINRCDSLEELLIDTPNLVLLEYEGIMRPSTLINIINAPCPWHLDFLLKGDYFDTLWFIKLKELLAKSNEAVYLNIIVDKDSGKFSFNLKDINKHRISCDPLFEVEELILSVWSFKSSYAFLVEGLLWSCRPKTLFVMSDDFEYQKKLVKLFNGCFLDREDPNCCRSSDENIKCWRHYLKDVKIESVDGLEGVKYHPDICPPTYTRYTLKWGPYVSPKKASDSHT